MPQYNWNITNVGVSPNQSIYLM